MTNAKSIADSVKGKENRITRGIRLYKDRASEIAVYLDGTYGVPSNTAEDVLYSVDLEAESCECLDHQMRRSVCLHLVAATYYRARRRHFYPFGVPTSEPAAPAVRTCRRERTSLRRAA